MNIPFGYVPLVACAQASRTFEPVYSIVTQQAPWPGLSAHVGPIPSQKSANYGRIVETPQKIAVSTSGIFSPDRSNAPSQTLSHFPVLFNAISALCYGANKDDIKFNIMYENPKERHCKKIRKRTPSYSRRVPRIEVLLWRTTTDDDLEMRMEVCYRDLGGAYTKLATITDIIEQDGIKLYLLSTSSGAYTADELKLIIKGQKI